jgi:hypothetical protein
MKRSATIFFQIVIFLIGTGVLAFLLWEPHLEGRNVNATLFEIYFKDPFLAYAYIASIPFFVAIYQAIKLLGFMGKNEIYSQASMKALRTIKYCAVTLVAFVVGAQAYLVTVQRTVEDDIAGGVMMGLVIIVISVVVAAGAYAYERALQRKNKL